MSFKENLPVILYAQKLIVQESSDSQEQIQPQGLCKSRSAQGTEPQGAMFRRSVPNKLRLSLAISLSHSEPCTCDILVEIKVAEVQRN